MNKLQIQKYLTEDTAKTPILNALTSEAVKKLFILAPMGSGKSHFTLNEIRPLAKANHCKTILVLPNTFNVRQMESDLKAEIKTGKVCVLYKGKRDNKTAELYITTPDSISKINQMDREGRAIDFYIVYDECHSEVTQLFRKKAFNQVRELVEYSNIKKVVYLTATGDMFQENEFDAAFKAVAEEMLTVDNFEIVRAESMGTTVILQQIKAVLSKNKKAQMIIINDDKKQNEEIKRVLKRDLKRTDVITYSSETPKDDEVISFIQENKKFPNNINIMITTCAFTSGINLYMEKETFHMLYVLGTTEFRKEDMIQAMGRNRNGVKEFRLLLKDRMSQDEKNEILAKEGNFEATCFIDLKEYSYFYSQNMRAIKESVKRANKDKVYRTLHKDLIRVMYGVYGKGLDLENGKVAINTQEIKAISLDLFNVQLVYNAEFLQDYMMDSQNAIYIKKTKITKCAIKKTKEQIAEEKALAEAKKAEKEAIKEEVIAGVNELAEIYQNTYATLVYKAQSKKSDDVIYPISEEVEVMKGFKLVVTPSTINREMVDLNSESLDLKEQKALDIKAESIFQLPFVAIDEDGTMSQEEIEEEYTRNLKQNGLEVDEVTVTSITDAVLKIRQDLEFVQELSRAAYNSRSVANEDTLKVDHTTYKEVLKEMALNEKVTNYYEEVEAMKERNLSKAVNKELKLSKVSDMTTWDLKKEIMATGLTRSQLVAIKDYRYRAIRILLEKDYRNKNALTDRLLQETWEGLNKLGLTNTSVKSADSKREVEATLKLNKYKAQLEEYKAGKLTRKPTCPKCVDAKTLTIKEVKAGEITSQEKAKLIKDINVVFKVTQGRITGLNK